jgi:hypothetical protein
MADDSTTESRILGLMEQISEQGAERNQKLDIVSARLEVFGSQLTRQAERLEEVEKKLTKLNEIVAGSDERSLVLRLSRLEQQGEVSRQQMVELKPRIEALEEWKSRAAGIAVAVVLLWTVAITVLNFVLR